MNKVLFAFLVILTTALMGSSFTIGKIGLGFASPLLLVSLRFLIAGFIMAVIVKACYRPHPKRYKSWLKIFLIGFTQTAGVMGCIFVSLRTITAGESSILTFINPLFVVIFATIFLKIRYRFRQWAGVFIGFIGVFITLGAQLELETGTFLGLLSACLWAVSTLFIKKWANQFDIWVLTAYQMLFGGLILLALSFMLETPFIRVTITSFLLITWLAIMASIVQFAAWFYLLQKSDPGKTSAFLFLAPFFGVLSGWLILDEIIEWYFIVGGFLIFIGIFLVNWTARSKVNQL